MTSITSILNTRNQQIANYDYTKLALGDNEFVSHDYTATGDTTLAAGLVLGKVAATGALVDYNPAAIDGSQFPIGILFLGVHEDVTILDTTTETLTLINKGRVAESLVSFPGGVTIDDIIAGDGRTVRDYLNAMGIILEGGTELTKIDNQ
jgi:hypothetical protein